MFMSLVFICPTESPDWLALLIAAKTLSSTFAIFSSRFGPRRIFPRIPHEEVLFTIPSNTRRHHRVGPVQFMFRGGTQESGSAHAQPIEPGGSGASDASQFKRHGGAAQNPAAFGHANGPESRTEARGKRNR